MAGITPTVMSSFHRRASRANGGNRRLLLHAAIRGEAHIPTWNSKIKGESVLRQCRTLPHKIEKAPGTASRCHGRAAFIHRQAPCPVPEAQNRETPARYGGDAECGQGRALQWPSGPYPPPVSLSCAGSTEQGDARAMRWRRAFEATDAPCRFASLHGKARKSLRPLDTVVSFAPLGLAHPRLYSSAASPLDARAI